MSEAISGMHHVTAIASDPQRNVDFYAGILGLRLVKITINYDDPGSYHLYYGDGAGSPGSILTFFAWPGGYKGRIGAAQAAVTALSVPSGSLEHWKARLEAKGVATGAITARWDESVLPLTDPDGLALELVAHANAGSVPAWNDGPVPGDLAVRGIHSVALSLRDPNRTTRLLTETMGFAVAETDGARTRLRASGEGIARRVDLLAEPERRNGSVGVGAVHHVAWRTPDDATQAAWQERLTEQGFAVSPIMDRQYFHSIYFREPGGVLFEIATDPPGFTADEPLDKLGTSLRLPSWLEAHRGDIQNHLPALVLPNATTEVR